MLDFLSKASILTVEVIFMALPAERGTSAPEPAPVFAPRFYKDAFRQRILSKELLIGQLEAASAPVEDVSITRPPDTEDTHPDLSPVITMRLAQDVFERIESQGVRPEGLSEGEHPLFIATGEGGLLSSSRDSELAHQEQSQMAATGDN
jgi:hypothetical protein